jgi:hypothetical protein
MEVFVLIAIVMYNISIGICRSVTMEYLSALDFAQKWVISKRRVQILCIENRIAGVKKVGNMWLIPEDAENPKDGRVKNISDGGDIHE